MPSTLSSAENKNLDLCIAGLLIWSSGDAIEATINIDLNPPLVSSTVDLQEAGNQRFPYVVRK
jgi:hypothetical protein